MDEDDTAMSYAEWNAAGYHVVKGSKSQMRDALGVPQFTKSQVEKNRPTMSLGQARARSRGASFSSSPYYREHEVPPGAYSNNRLPCQKSMDYHMSMLNPTHRVLRSLESHLDSVFEKHHGGDMREEEDFW